MYQRIRDLREDKDLSQRELAEYLNCSQVSYSYYELGKRTIPPEVLIALATYHGVSVDYLLGLTDQPHPYPRGKQRTWHNQNLPLPRRGRRLRRPSKTSL